MINLFILFWQRWSWIQTHVFSYRRRVKPVYKLSARSIYIDINISGGSRIFKRGKLIEQRGTNSRIATGARP